ncbi:MAG: flavin reductase family protein [Eggerthellaceae bacterium]|jgi:flavin reductase (DIM6/NTAB) family NADH-FMN oxidoreductase RutF
MIDRTAFRSLSYGLYIVTAKSESTRAGCVVNTFAQVTSQPAQVGVAINKENVTAQVIEEAGVFEVSVLAQDAPMVLIGRFGFRSSADYDKFAETETAVDERGIPYVTEHTVAHFLVEVAQTLDLGSHRYFVGQVVDASVLDQAEPLTYSYYQKVKGGKTPPKASGYEGPSA